MSSVKGEEGKSKDKHSKTENDIEEYVTYLKESGKGLDSVGVIVDIENAVEDFGINVMWSDMSAFKKERKNVLGYTTLMGGRPTIVVNGDVALSRKNKYEERYIIAYLLGHLLIVNRVETKDFYEEDSHIMCYNNISETIEEFALRFLIDGRLYSKMVEMYNVDEDSQNSLVANSFKVSESILKKYKEMRK